MDYPPPETAGDPWVVRILDGRGGILGGGVVLGTDRVLTCAHVVRDRAADVRIVFVGRPDLPPAAATVAAAGWFPPLADEAQDIALLALSRSVPPGMGARLRRRPMTKGLAVRAVGFPRTAPTGLLARAEVAGPHGPRNEWVQLNTVGAARGPLIRPGYSGTGVVDESTGDVIGIVVVAYEGDDAASMIPVETIIKYLSLPAEWIVGAPALDQSIVDRYRAGPVDPVGKGLAAFLGRSGDSMMVVSDAGRWSVSSTALATVLVLADRERRPRDVEDDQVVRELLPVGSVDLAIDVTGLTVADVCRRLADRVGSSLAEDADPRTVLDDRLPPLTVVLDGVDEASTPEDLVRDFVDGLIRRGSRLLLLFRRSDSVAASIASQLQQREPRRPELPFPELDRKHEQVMLAETSANELHKLVAARIRSAVVLPRRRSELRFALTQLRAASPHTDPETMGRAIDRWLDAVDLAIRDALASRDALTALVARCDELRGRLDGYQAMAARLGRAEDLDLAALHARAYELLWTVPVDLDQASPAVDRYAAAVCGGHRPGSDD